LVASGLVEWRKTLAPLGKRTPVTGPPEVEPLDLERRDKMLPAGSGPYTASGTDAPSSVTLRLVPAGRSRMKLQLASGVPKKRKKRRR
jgi:hypothetical protein